MARPYDVALVQLISLYEDPDANYRPGTHEGILRFLLREMGAKKSTTSIRYPKLSELLQALRAALPEEDRGILEEDLLEKLHSLQSPDNMLQSFMETHKIMYNSPTAPDPMAPGVRRLHPRSALGIFLRRCVAEAIAMPFEGLCRLCSDVSKYVAEDDQDMGAHGSLSDTLRLERALDARVAGVGRMAGRSHADDLESDMAQLQSGAGALPKVHYLRHKAALRRRDASAADAELRRYFDYSSGRQRPTLAGARPVRPLCGAAPDNDPLLLVTAFASGGANNRPGPAHIGAELDPASAGYSSTSGIGRFQSALLSLGAAHTDLGHTSEAYEALEETVRIAQAASDGSVLIHALAALCRLTMVSPPDKDPITMASLATGGGNALPGEPLAATHHRVLLHLLHRCLTRSRELKLPHLVSFARLAIAQVRLQHGESPRGASSLELLGSGAAEGPSLSSLDVRAAQHEAEALRHLTSLAVTMPSAAPGAQREQPGGMAGVSGVRSLTDVFPSTSGLFTGTAGAASAAAAVSKLSGRAHLLSAASWNLHGCLELAALHGLIHTACYEGTADSDDTAAALSGLVEVAALTQGPEASSRALKIAAAALPADGGTHPRLKSTEAGLEAQGASAAGDVHGAAAAVGSLASMAPPGSGPENDVWLQAEMMGLQALMTAQRNAEAIEAAGKLFQTCLAAGQQVACVRVLGLIGRSHLEAGSPATAIPYLLACSSHSDTLGMELEGAYNSISLAEAWCALGSSHVLEALDLLRRLLPLVLGCGSTESRARAQLAMARAMLLAADRSDVQSNPQAVLGLLNSAAEAYSEIKAWPLAGESRYLAALVADSAGLSTRRDSEAEAWRRCTVEAERHQLRGAGALLPAGAATAVA